MTTQTTGNDWDQVAVNLETQLETGYSYGLYHDLVVARAELAKLNH